MPGSVLVQFKDGTSGWFLLYEDYRSCRHYVYRGHQGSVRRVYVKPVAPSGWVEDQAEQVLGRRL
jgi:hypothetical protein